MDFFHGLDNRRYASFKAEIINGLTAGSIVQPKDLNAMYLLANQWLKTAKSHPTGLAATFNTTLDQVNAVSDGRFTRTQVLIDNQADVSIVHPSLLRNKYNAS
mmetsp:Transcript_9406/g.13614  ORF Transcript_9406/g.13614 Transcript_9406/m.13614 type:complete len:103 (-) Transcript_9406:187-495(-)